MLNGEKNTFPACCRNCRYIASAKSLSSTSDGRSSGPKGGFRAGPIARSALIRCLILLQDQDVYIPTRPTVPAQDLANGENPRRIVDSSQSGSNAAHSPASEIRFERQAG